MKHGSPPYAAGNQPDVPPIVHEVLTSPSHLLDPDTRAYMEPRFGHDFSRVKVHSGAAAEQSAREMNANAYTMGQDVVFGAGRFESGTQEGRRLIAHELTHVVQQDSILPIQSSHVHVTPAAVIQRKQKMDSKQSSFPWIGRIEKTWSAALRKSPWKAADNPHGNTLADLLSGTEVAVINRKGGWLLVTVSIGGKTLQGYVSQELVSYVKSSAFELPENKKEVKIPSLAKAFVEIKKAEKRKKKEGSAFKPSDEEKDRIDLAIVAINKTKKYVVDESIYVVSFAHKPGVKTEIESIEDFILFVEQVEKQYPTATPEQVVSEIRQLWFSDVNWELLVASEGISEAGKDVDIETNQTLLLRSSI